VQQVFSEKAFPECIFPNKNKLGKAWISGPWPLALILSPAGLGADC